MNRTTYQLTEDDLYVGAELLCTYSNGTSHIAGKVYEVRNSDVQSSWPHSISGESPPTVYHYNMYEINEPLYGPVFVPMDRLSKKELFTFKMCGKMPERFYRDEFKRPQWSVHV